MPWCARCTVLVHRPAKAHTSASACSMVVTLSCTRCVRPLLPWCSMHHSFMASMTSLLWWMAMAGPCRGQRGMVRMNCARPGGRQGRVAHGGRRAHLKHLLQRPVCDDARYLYDGVSLAVQPGHLLRGTCHDHVVQPRARTHGCHQAWRRRPTLAPGRSTPAGSVASWACRSLQLRCAGHAGTRVCAQACEPAHGHAACARARARLPAGATHLVLATAAHPAATTVVVEAVQGSGSGSFRPDSTLNRLLPLLPPFFLGMWAVARTRLFAFSARSINSRERHQIRSGGEVTT